MRFLKFIVLLSLTTIYAYSVEAQEVLIDTSKVASKAEGILNIIEKANSGDIESINFYGYMLINRRIEMVGDDADFTLGYQEAARVLRLNAENNYAESMINLAFLYNYGMGVTANKDSTLYWVKRAAVDLNDNAAQLNLGDFYSTGTVVEKDIDTAIDWYKKSAENGNVQALTKVIQIYALGELEQEIDHLEMVKWAKIGSELGHAFSQRMQGISYYSGEGVEVDYQKAAYWIKKAMDNGDTIAANIWNNPEINLQQYLED